MLHGHLRSHLDLIPPVRPDQEPLDQDGMTFPLHVLQSWNSQLQLWSIRTCWVPLGSHPHLELFRGSPSEAWPPSRPFIPLGSAWNSTFSPNDPILKVQLCPGAPGPSGDHLDPTLTWSCSSSSSESRRCPLEQPWDDAALSRQPKPSQSPHHPTSKISMSRYLLKLLSVDCWLDFPGEPSEPCRWADRRLSVSREYLPSPSECTLGVSRNSLSFQVPTVPSRAWYRISMEMLVCKTRRHHQRPWNILGNLKSGNSIGCWRF